MTIVGTVLSPEYVYTIGPGQMMPDNRNMGMIWMRERALAAAFDMTGAFNSISLLLLPGTPVERAIDDLERILAPYGNDGANGRETQISHSFLDGEITQLRTLSYILPPVFIGITVFLVNMVIGRIVALERAEIGLMKAIGYSDLTISLHYLMLAGLIAVVGVGIGWGVGTWLARAMAELYAEFFTFPYLIFAMGKDVYVLSGAHRFRGRLRGVAARRAFGGATAARGGDDAPCPAALQAHLARPRDGRAAAEPAHRDDPALGRAMAAAVGDDDPRDRAGGRGAGGVELRGRRDRRHHRQRLPPAEPAGRDPDPGRRPARDCGRGRAPPARRDDGRGRDVPWRHDPQRAGVEKDSAIQARRPGTDLSRMVDASGRTVEPPPVGIVLSDRLAEAAGRGRRRHGRGRVPFGRPRHLRHPRRRACHAVLRDGRAHGPRRAERGLPAGAAGHDDQPASSTKAGPRTSTPR